MVPPLISEEETANFRNSMDGPAKMVVAKKGRENVYAILFAAFTKSYYYSNRGLLFTIFIAKTTGCSIRKLSMTVAPQ